MSEEIAREDEQWDRHDLKALDNPVKSFIETASIGAAVSVNRNVISLAEQEEIGPFRGPSLWITELDRVELEAAIINLTTNARCPAGPRRGGAPGRPSTRSP
jgi:hypothetical protein